MIRMRLTAVLFTVILLTSFTEYCQARTVKESVSRRNIHVSYEYRDLDDGFGNIRKVLVTGTVQNQSTRIASKINISFTFTWKNRRPDIRRVEVPNVLVDEVHSFDFIIELATQPDVLKSVFCNIDQIKFTNTREASELTSSHLVTHELYSLARLNEEGKAFIQILDYLRMLLPFRSPERDEFETTNEFENRVNNGENQHFAKIMDELEKRYGALIGGHNAIIRFLPRTFHKKLIYLSECSAFFVIPIHLGRYNADKSQFEGIAMNPRTFPFLPQTAVPDADFQFIHKSGMFFLRKTDFAIGRSEARLWREQEKALVLEATVRFGVIQDGPYFQDYCIVEKVVLRNNESGKVFREWLINP